MQIIVFSFVSLFLIGVHKTLETLKIKIVNNVERTELWLAYQFSSLTQSCLTLCNPIDYHARLNCPSLTPRACSDSCPSSQWCHPTTSSSIVPFSYFQSFPASGSFPMSQFFAWDGQSVGVSISACLSNEYSGLTSFEIDWFGLLAVQGIINNLLQHHSSKVSILWHSTFFMVQLSHLYMTTGKTIPLARQNFVGKVMSLLFNMLSRLVITFLPGSKHLLISWLQSPSAVILEPNKIKSVTVSTVSPPIC